MRKSPRRWSLPCSLRALLEASRPASDAAATDVAGPLRPRLQMCNCRPGCASASSTAVVSKGQSATGFAEDREDLYRSIDFDLPEGSRSLVLSCDSGPGRTSGRAKRSGQRSTVPRSIRSASRTCRSRQRRAQPLSVRVGRQELAFGDQRLVGHVNWLNTARSFDAVRGVFRHQKIRIDGFAASVVTPLVDEFNWSGACGLVGCGSAGGRPGGAHP